MAVMMRSEMLGVTSEQISPFVESTLDEMRAFPGFICQASGPISGGFQVTEVWETQEAHERWLREVIAPRAAQQLGLTETPQGHYYTLDRYITR